MSDRIRSARGYKPPVCPYGFSLLAAHAFARILSRHFASLCVAVFFSLSALSLSAADRWQVSDASRRVRLEGAPTGTEYPGSPVGWVEFYHAGEAKSDGGDLRVYSASGKPLRCMVLQDGPGTFLRVAFEMAPGQERYYVYYGIPNPGKPPAWEPKRGLILETRRYTTGYPKNLNAMRLIIRRAGDRYGRGFVPFVFQGYNVFGENDRFVSIYSGWLNAPKAGEYIFCTSSDDASFLLVDGKQAVAWPGSHGARPRAKYTGKLRLASGPHKFEYLHVNLGGPTIAVAAWQPPGAKKVWPIQPDDFLPVTPCRLEAYEGREGSAAGFTAEIRDEMYIGEIPFILMRYKCMTPDAGNVRWEFGDGQVGSGGSVDHLYAAIGLHSVTMTVTVGNKRLSATQKIMVSRNYAEQLKSHRSNVKKLARIFSTYDFGGMSVPELMCIARVFQDAGAEDKRLEVYSTVLNHPDAGKNLENVWAAARELALRQRETDPKSAIATLRKAEVIVAGDNNLRAKVKREIGDVYYYYLHDLERARDEYDQVVGRYAGLEDDIVRITKIRIGDVWRDLGSYEKAVKNYREAEKYRINEWPEERLEARRGMLAQAVEQLTKRGEYDEAQKWLNIWEWEFPADKLKGPLSLAAGKTAFEKSRQSKLDGKLVEAKRSFIEAQKRFLQLAEINPDSPQAAECLFQAARCAKRLGDMGRVKMLLRKIMDGYPDDPRCADAKKVLDALTGGK